MFWMQRVFHCFPFLSRVTEIHWVSLSPSRHFHLLELERHSISERTSARCQHRPACKCVDIDLDGQTAWPYWPAYSGFRFGRFGWPDVTCDLWALNNLEIWERSPQWSPVPRHPKTHSASQCPVMSNLHQSIPHDWLSKLPFGNHFHLETISPKFPPVNCTPCIALGIMFFLFPVRSDDHILSRSDDLISFWSSDRILPLKKGRDF